MNEKDCSGPAFPVPHGMTSGYMASFAGMTLRDYFAAKAMARRFSEYEVFYDEDLDDLALASYQMADAMLKAREA